MIVLPKQNQPIQQPYIRHLYQPKFQQCPYAGSGGNSVGNLGGFALGGSVGFFKQRGKMITAYFQLQIIIISYAVWR